MNSLEQSASAQTGLGLGGKLWLSVLVLILSLVGIIAITTVRSNAITAQAEAELAQRSEKLELANRWHGLIEANVVRIQATSIAANPALDALFGEAIAQSVREVSAVQQQIEGSPALSRESQELLRRIAQQRQAALDALARIRELRAQGQAEAALREVTQSFNPIVPPYLASLREFSQLQRTELEQTQKRFATYRRANMRDSSLMVGALLLFILGGAALLIRSIRKPLKEVQVFAEQMAEGNLGARLRSDRSDEFGQMSRTLNAMREQIAGVVADVRRSTDGITAVSVEMASGSQNLSLRTEQSASSLEETAASMASMLEGISQSAASARSASELATAAGASAQKGRDVVVGVVQTMNDIQQASQKISDIIAVIDGIAFQTNILALNAAVEAARAGEQGRGFAVVASEVRSLAGRSAEAAKEIKTLINNSVERVWAGAEQVQTAGESIQAIVEQVERVRTVIAEISSASAEQAEGVAQINSAVGQLDQMTQQNAALVEESAAAATAMSEQAQQLAAVVRRFRLESAG